MTSRPPFIRNVSELPASREGYPGDDADNRVFYPLHPEGYDGMRPERKWQPEAPPPLGPHEGRPRSRR